MAFKKAAHLNSTCFEVMSTERTKKAPNAKRTNVWRLNVRWHHHPNIHEVKE
jgi:hypothetical protein